MTLLLIFISVLVITWSLWWLKDRFISGTTEAFQMETDGATIGYNFLTPEYQQQASATEPVTVPVVEQRYQQDIARSTQQIQTIQQSATDETNRFQMTAPMTAPMQPAEAAFAAAQAPAVSASVRAETAAADDQERLTEYRALVERRDRNLLESCYRDSCASEENRMDAECRTFNEECHIRHSDNIHLCLGSLKDKCDRSFLQKCKDTCLQMMGVRAERTSLKQDDVLRMNERIVSRSGSTTLQLSDEGSLELWFNHRLLWSIQATSSAAAALMGPYKMQIYNNGDMAILNGVNTEIWHTNTWLDVFKAGVLNGPFELTVGEGEVLLKNKNGDVLWKK